MDFWIDTHCHLDAPEFSGDVEEVVTRAHAGGVGSIVIPAIARFDFETVRALAHRFDLAYALGVHPLLVNDSQDEDLDMLDEALSQCRGDPRLVAIGEIGIEGLLPGHDGPRHRKFYEAQLKLAQRHGLPVIVHVRRSADVLLAQLRRIETPGGIAHAFNGSEQQARMFVDLGFKLGFGGAMTFDRALQIRRLATDLPLSSLVLETDAPDIPPHWLYKTAAQRAQGQVSGRNEPAQVPRIAQTLAELRRLTIEEVRAATTANALSALPRLAALLDRPPEARAFSADRPARTPENDASP